MAPQTKHKGIFSILDKKILKNRLKYYFLKVVPRGVEVSLELTNNLKYRLRGRSADKTVFKEIWLNKLYDQYGVKIEKGDTVVDIGAHVGIFSTYAAEQSQTGKIFSFEPFVENYKRLQFHKKVNNKDQIVPFNYGISEMQAQKFCISIPKTQAEIRCLKAKTKKKKWKLKR